MRMPKEKDCSNIDNKGNVQGNLFEDSRPGESSHCASATGATPFGPKEPGDGISLKAAETLFQ